MSCGKRALAVDNNQSKIKILADINVTQTLIHDLSRYLSPGLSTIDNKYNLLFLLDKNKFSTYTLD
jgi:hypothetical protein